MSPSTARALWVSALVLLSSASAQTITVAGAVGVPQGEFGDALGAVGGGLSVTALYPIPRSPVAVGVEGTGLLYGYESRRVPFSLTVPDVAVDVTTSNNVALGLAVLRLQVPDGPVRPYVDGLVGASYLWTQTTVGDERDGYALASSTNYDDLALAVGAGLGLQARVYRGLSREGRPYDVLLDARVRYLAGGEATYLDRGDLARYSDGTVGVSPRRSRTDLLLPQFGVTFRL